MAKLVRALGVLLVLSGPGGVAEAGPKDRSYTIEFQVSGNNIVATKTKDEQFYEIHYTITPFSNDQSFTRWTFTNRSGGPIFFQFKESGACHFDFIGVAVGKACDSGVLSLDDGNSTTLIGQARDLSFGEYYNSLSKKRHKSDITVGREKNKLDPVDPQLQIERDWLFRSQLTFAVAVTATLAIFVAVGLFLARRGRVS